MVIRYSPLYISLLHVLVGIRLSASGTSRIEKIVQDKRISERIGSV
jgi:hypothetical protein